MIGHIMLLHQAKCIKKKQTKNQLKSTSVEERCGLDGSWASLLIILIMLISLRF